MYILWSMISPDLSTRTQLRAMNSVIGYKLSMSREKRNRRKRRRLAELFS